MASLNHTFNAAISRSSHGHKHCIYTYIYMILEISMSSNGGIDLLITSLASVDQKKQHFVFLEHSAPSSGVQNFKHPYLGNRWTKSNFFLFFLRFLQIITI